MPVASPGFRQLNLTFPSDLVDDAKAGADKAGVSITWEVEKILHRLAGRKPPKTPRKRGRKKNLEKSENS